MVAVMTMYNNLPSCTTVTTSTACPYKKIRPDNAYIYDDYSVYESENQTQGPRSYVGAPGVTGHPGYHESKKKNYSFKVPLLLSKNRFYLPIREEEEGSSRPKRSSLKRPKQERWFSIVRRS